MKSLNVPHNAASGQSRIVQSRHRRRATGMKITRFLFKQLVRDYEPLTFEVIPSSDHHRFRVRRHHVLKNCERLWVALRTAARYLPSGPLTVADLGTYPGSLLRPLRRLLAPETCRLVGIGLMTSADFRRAMAEDCGGGDYNGQSRPKE